MNSRTGGVEREFANRNPHAAGGEVSQPQNALAVGHDDHADVFVRPIVQNLGHPTGILGRNEKTARTTEDIRIFLARLADRRRIDQRHDLIQMVQGQFVEECFIAILQGNEILFQVGSLLPQVPEHARQLNSLSVDQGREKSAKSERVSFFLGEGGSLIEDRVVEEFNASGKLCRGCSHKRWRVI